MWPLFCACFGLFRRCGWICGSAWFWFCALAHQSELCWLPSGANMAQIGVLIRGAMAIHDLRQKEFVTTRRLLGLRVVF
eukprot:12883074-Prorocentrum_lima.AAC.1